MFLIKNIQSCIVMVNNIGQSCKKNGQSNNMTDCSSDKIAERISFVDCYVKFIFFYLAAILVVIGTILNLCSLFCFLRMKKRHSTNIYLLTLAIADTVNLQLHFTIPMIRQSEEIDDTLRSSNAICAVMGFLTEFFLIFPTWIVVLLSIEALIIISYAGGRDSSQARTRFKITMIILFVAVSLLSSYRVRDYKGIDQVSVFAVMACDDESYANNFMRHLNLVVWSILPEFCTLFICLIIIYKIKLAEKHFEREYSTVRRSKYNQATKTVLLISILFIISQTPTGILITLDLVIPKPEASRLSSIIFFSRRFTVLLYETSLCCKFFIYNKTFGEFKYILKTSFFPYLSRRNSARLGQRCLGNIRNCSAPPRFYFVPGRSPPPSLTSQTESLIRMPEDGRKVQMRSRSVSQTQKDKSPMNNNTTKSTEKTNLSSANSTRVKQKQKILRQQVS